MLDGLAGVKILAGQLPCKVRREYLFGIKLMQVAEKVISVRRLANISELRSSTSTKKQSGSDPS